jgi:hypothetical protein
MGKKLPICNLKILIDKEILKDKNRFIDLYVINFIKCMKKRKICFLFKKKNTTNITPNDVKISVTRNYYLIITLR